MQSCVFSLHADNYSMFIITAHQDQITRPLKNISIDDRRVHIKSPDRAYGVEGETIDNVSDINEPAIVGADLANFGICKCYRSDRQIRRLLQLDKLIKTNSKQ